MKQAEAVASIIHALPMKPRDADWILALNAAWEFGRNEGIPEGARIANELWSARAAAITQSVVQQ
jgi:hypothetical protein